MIIKFGSTAFSGPSILGGIPVGRPALVAGQVHESRSRIAFGSAEPLGNVISPTLPAIHERLAAFSALTLHVALIAALSSSISPSPEPIPNGGPMEISYISLPGAPPGDPHGNSAPPPPSPPHASPEIETSPPTEAVEEIAQDTVDAPLSEEATEPSEQVPKPSPAETAPAAQIASGTLAIGAKSRGLAQGLDPRLAETVGQAIATQVRACWTAPAGGVAQGASSTVQVRFSPDGQIEGQPQVLRVENEQEKPVTAPNALEVAALEALKRCAPIRLPAAIYAYWREVDVQLFAGPAV